MTIEKKFLNFWAEIIEDVTMEQAIAEGETTELVSRESIFQLWEGLENDYPRKPLK